MPCMGQHVPAPLNHLSGGVIMALWDATHPLIPMGLYSGATCCASIHREGAAGRETLRKAGEAAEGGGELGCPLAISRLIF